MSEKSLVSRTGSTVAGGLALVIFLIGIACFLWGGSGLASFPLDDAWIHRVYSRAFSAGQGFEYNPGAQEAGATSPLWVIVTSPAHWLEPFGFHAVVLGVKSIAVILGVMSIFLFQAIVRYMTESPTVAVVAASLLAVEPRLLFSCLSGMETPLLVVLWLGGIYAFLERKWILSATLFGLTPITRPESLVVVPICAIVFSLSNTKSPLWKRVVVLLALGLPFFLWTLLCKRTAGHWLPNTYYLKSRPVQLTHQVVIDAWHVVTSHGFASLFIFVVGVIVGAFYLVNRQRVAVLLFLVLGPLVYLTGVVGSRQIVTEGYYWTRWVDPTSVLLTAAFALGYSLLLTGNVNPSRRRKSRARSVVMAVAILGLVVCIPAFARSFQDRRTHLITDSQAIDRINVAAGLWIREHTPPSAIIGVNDAGAIRYFGERTTVDLLGLNNQDVAFGRVGPAEALIQNDWLAIFPSVFARQKALIDVYFEPVTVFQIPLADYTICDCPGQTTKAIFKRKP